MNFVSKFINNQRRINRAGKIKKNETKLYLLKSNSYLSNEETKQALKLSNKIGKDKERNKIASEQKSKYTINKNKNNFNLNLNSNNKSLLGISIQPSKNKNYKKKKYIY